MENVSVDVCLASTVSTTRPLAAEPGRPACRREVEVFFKAPAVAAGCAERALGTEGRTTLSGPGLSGRGGPVAPTARGPDGWRKRVERPDRRPRHEGGAHCGLRFPAISAHSPRRPSPARGRRLRDARSGRRTGCPWPSLNQTRGRERAKPGERPRERNWPGKRKEAGDGAR